MADDRYHQHPEHAHDHAHDHEHDHEPDEAAVKAQLSAALEQLPYPVNIHLFARGNDPFNQGAREALRVFADISPKLIVHEHKPGGKTAQKMGVQDSPTLLFEPERYRIRWVGAPLGEEGRTFVEMLFLIGRADSDLSEDSQKMLKRLEEFREVRVFVSPSCPYCPQQAINAVKAAVQRPDQVAVELIDVQCQPQMAETYAAQGVPQTYANAVRIGSGAQSEELFVQSLLKLEEQRVYIPESEAEEVQTDLVIVGGGPAGLTAAIYAVRSGLKAAIVEKELLGGQVATTPVVENYPGFTQVGGKTLVDIMVQHALQYGEIFQGETVVDIAPGERLAVTTNRRRFYARAVLLATGATHRRLGVPGESRLAGRGVSYCSTCDGPIFKGKRVIMVGGGNSAVTEALHLFHIGVDVTLVHRRDRLRAQDHLSKNLFDNRIPVLWNTEVREIRGDKQVGDLLLYNNQTGETFSKRVDGVFVAIGYDPAVELARKLGVALTAEGYIQRDGHHRTNIPGIYSAGDVEGGYKQIVTAAGQGAEAAMAIFEDLIHPYWKKAGGGEPYA